ncbi:MAG: hypothetical protein P4M13_08505 [Alphaproteobacteria bacterium]|nr:hypothetical protein [Alphaproteobacteria bacterium]
MSAELSAKVQIALWWIASIAVSVLCCSALFVLFASYLVDVKMAIKDSEVRISSVEQQESRILEEIEMIRKHIVLQSSQRPAVAPQAPAASAPTPAPTTETPDSSAPPAAATEAPADLTVGGSAPDNKSSAPAVAVPSEKK